MDTLSPIPILTPYTIFVFIFFNCSCFLHMSFITHDKHVLFLMVNTPWCVLRCLPFNQFTKKCFSVCLLKGNFNAFCTNPWGVCTCPNPHHKPKQEFFRRSNFLMFTKRFGGLEGGAMAALKIKLTSWNRIWICKIMYQFSYRMQQTNKSFVMLHGRYSGEICLEQT